MEIGELIKLLKQYPSHYWLKVDVGPFATGISKSRTQPAEFIVLNTSDVI